MDASANKVIFGLRGRQTAFAVLALCLAFAAGCSTPSKPLTIYDTTGTVVATGTIQLPSRFPELGPFVGSWALRSSTPGFPKQSTNPEHYIASSRGQPVDIWLNGHVLDDNVVLHVAGDVVDGSFSGPWTWEQAWGGRTGGTFAVGTPTTRPVGP
jgi:hypothetical protein